MPRSGRAWRRAATVALAVVILMELLLRLPQAEAVVGTPTLFYHPGVAERIEVLDHVLAEHDEVDVLFLGSSVVRTNLRPLVFDAELATAGYETVSFNGGLSSMEIDPTRLYLEQVWLPRARPRMIVQALRYEDLLDAEPVAEFAPFSGGRYEKLWMSDSPLARLQEFALDHSRLVQNAGLLTDVLVSPQTSRNREGFAIDERGFNSTERRLSEARLEFAIEDIPGGLAADGGYTAPLDPAGFEAAFGMLERTIALAHDAGVHYVLVNMPEHADKFLGHPDGEARYRQYLDALTDFAEAEGVPFVDLAGGDLSAFGDDGRFADFHHMTPDGALDLTRDLAGAFIDGGIVDLLEEG